MKIYNKIVFAFSVIPMAIIGMIFGLFLILILGADKSSIFIEEKLNKDSKKLEIILNHCCHIIFLVMLYIALRHFANL